MSRESVLSTYVSAQPASARIIMRVRRLVVLNDACRGSVVVIVRKSCCVIVVVEEEEGRRFGRCRAACGC